jgi:hypothetical protein
MFKYDDNWWLINTEFILAHLIQPTTPSENRLNQRDLHLKAALLEKLLYPTLKISVTQQLRCGIIKYILYMILFYLFNNKFIIEFIIISYYRPENINNEINVL